MATVGSAQDADLAQQLANPLASLISMPLQYNFNSGYGDDDGEQHVLNIQPVIPISISPNWNVISRTIIPLIDQTGVVPGTDGQSGIGGIVQNFFFSPKAPTASGLVWGVGPIIAAPTLDEGPGSEQWSLGPTAVILRSTGPVTLGFLGNHTWSVTDNDTFGETSATFLQPFVSYTTAGSTTYSLNTESTYNWTNEEWSVPINVSVAQLTKVGGYPVQFSAGVRYWADAPERGPDGWGLRLGVTYLFPK